MLWAIAFATPFFLVFGWLSDRIGRKWIMLIGMLLGVLFYRPIFSTFLKDTHNHPEYGYTGYPPLSAVGGDSRTDDGDIAFNSNGTITLSDALQWKFTGLVWVMIVFVTMVYGPIAAFLVEMFPTKIRYTSMSLPYHIGNGVFGGLVPFIGLLITTSYPADPLAGLWYPIAIAALCFVTGATYLSCL